jgi:histidinol-phosphate phosphatase family protein
MNKAIFLDRDGVLIHNRTHYVRSWEDVKIYPSTLKSLSILANSDYKIIILSNQSAVGRGLMSLQTMNDVNDRLISIIKKSGGRVDAVFICPHAPENNCNCRKPKPGLVFEAKKEFALDLENSWLVGDALTDLQTGLNSGIKNLVLVESGRGKKQLNTHKYELSHIKFSIKKNLWDSINLFT